MHAALVTFGLSKPPFKVEGILRQIPCLSPNKQPRGKARHHAAHVALHRISTLLELCLQALKLRLPLGRCACRGIERCLDRPESLDVGLQRLLEVLDGRQPAVNVAR